MEMDLLIFQPKNHCSLGVTCADPFPVFDIGLGALAPIPKSNRNNPQQRVTAEMSWFPRAA